MQAAQFAQAAAQARAAAKVGNGGVGALEHGVCIGLGKGRAQVAQLGAEAEDLAAQARMALRAGGRVQEGQQQPRIAPMEPETSTRASQGSGRRRRSRRSSCSISPPWRDAARRLAAQSGTAPRWPVRVRRLR